MKKSKIILLFSILLLIGLFVIRFKAESNYILKTENHTSGVVTECLKNSKMIIKGKSKLLVEYESFACEPGINVNVHGYFTLPENSKVFYLFNYRKYLLSKNIKYLFKATKVEKASDKIILKYQIKNIIYKYLEGYKSKDYMYAFLLADSKDIDKSYIENYRRTGIIHLFSISGVHIAIMTSILLTALGKIFKDKDTSFFITFVFLIFYLFLTNFSPPIVRATILFISLNIGKIFNIKVKSLYITLFSFLILLVANPFYIYSVGFILSYVISIFIILSNKIIKRIKHNLTKNVVLQVICFLASYPITVNSNFEIHLLSLFASLVFTPLICFIIYPLCLTSLIFRPFDYAVYHMMDLINSLTSRLDSIDLFNIPFSHINIFFIIVYYAILLLCILKPQNFLIIILFIIIHYNINYINFIPLITTIDIGQGDSILVKIEKINILIDTGGDPFFKDRKISQNIIIPYLKAEGIHKLDYLILSHGDYDHMGEAVNLVNNFKIEKVIFNCGTYNDLEKDLIKVLDKKGIPYYSCIKELNIDNNKLYFLQTKEYDNENDNSNVIYTEIDGYKFMFMGDAGIDKEKDILDKYNISNIDVLKVGHHGSKTSSGKEFIDAINPKYSVISVGKNNRYGHPNKEALENLSNSKIYRTDQDGSIMFKIRNSNLKIETCAP